MRNGISEQHEIWRRGDNAKALYDIRQARELFVQPLEKGESERASRVKRPATGVYSAPDMFLHRRIGIKHPCAASVKFVMESPGKFHGAFL
jgi:hypothetical protein